MKTEEQEGAEGGAGVKEEAVAGEEAPSIEKLKAQEEQCNALVNGLLPYEIELLADGHDSYQKIRNDLIQLIDPPE